MRYGSWDTGWEKNFFSHFVPYFAPNNLENQNFEKKMKKLSEDVIVLHM